jgi:hypothetical protein
MRCRAGSGNGENKETHLFILEEYGTLCGLCVHRNGGGGERAASALPTVGTVVSEYSASTAPCTTLSVIVMVPFECNQRSRSGTDAGHHGTPRDVRAGKQRALEGSCWCSTGLCSC